MLFTLWVPEGLLRNVSGQRDQGQLYWVKNELQGGTHPIHPTTTNVAPVFGSDVAKWGQPRISGFPGNLMADFYPSPSGLSSKQRDGSKGYERFTSCSQG